jgi:hypothetical protein
VTHASRPSKVLEYIVKGRIHKYREKGIDDIPIDEVEKKKPSLSDPCSERSKCRLDI